MVGCVTVMIVRRFDKTGLKVDGSLWMKGVMKVLKNVDGAVAR